MSIIEDTELAKLISDGNSLIRYGDGEAMLIVGRDIHFQKASRQLASELQKIVTDYSGQSKYTLAIPINKITPSEKSLGKKQVKTWRLFRVLFSTRFDPQEKYASAMIFYSEKFFRQNIVPVLKDRHIICVGNENNLTSSLRQYFQTNFESAAFITCPGQNAYETKNELLSSIIDSARNNPASKSLVLISAGPVSKILVYELCSLGIQSLDLGHGLDVLAKKKNREHKM